MAVKRNRINIEVRPSAGSEASRNDPTYQDTALKALASLIGRQIAREHFERKEAQERKVSRGKGHSST